MAVEIKITELSIQKPLKNTYIITWYKLLTAIEQPRNIKPKKQIKSFSLV